jgi:hypothetical protein
MDFAKLISKIDSIESKQSLNEGWEDMMKHARKDHEEKEKEKGTGKFDKKETSTGTVYTRKSSTFDDGGDDSDTKKAKKDARKAKKDKTDESVENLDEWGAGMDAVENVSVDQALAALQKYAPDAKVGPGFIKAGNTEVTVSRDDKVALADLNKAVRTLKGVSVNPLRRVQEEEDVDMEEGIEDRIGANPEAETDKEKQTSFNTPAVQRKAQAGDTAANDTMNRLRTLAGQPVKEAETVEEEDDVEEGAGVMHFKAQQAKADGKDSFKLGDKTYPVKESAAPGQEDWIKSNKAKFIKQYGKTKGEEVLYATAWKRSKAVKESLQFEECYDQAMSQQSDQESGMNISSNLDTKTGNKSLTVTAQGAAAEELAQILKLSGMHAQAEEPMEEEYANTPEPVIQGMEVQMQQGNDLNRPKHMTKHGYQQGDNPMAMAEAAELAAIEKRLMEELDSIKVVSEKYMGFDKTVAAIKKGGNAKNPEAVAASIGRKKYGKEKFQKAAAAGKKLGK